jgi:gliding motility-associated-like protein
MKKISSLILILFLAVPLAAQISFQLRAHNVLCNHTEFGSAAVSITSTNPPYSVSWSSGQTTDSIYGQEEGDYTVTIIDGLGNDTTGTIHIGLNECNMVPSLFITPNGDNIHDVWDITNYGFFPLAHILVFNRLGQKVYEHKGLYDQPWDGRDITGVVVPDASYFYVIYQDGNDEGTILKGSMTVLK